MRLVEKKDGWHAVEVYLLQEANKISSRLREELARNVNEQIRVVQEIEHQLQRDSIYLSRCFDLGIKEALKGYKGTMLDPTPAALQDWFMCAG